MALCKGPCSDFMQKGWAAWKLLAQMSDMKIWGIWVWWVS